MQTPTLRGDDSTIYVENPPSYIIEANPICSHYFFFDEFSGSPLCQQSVFPTANRTIVQTHNMVGKENTELDDPMDWLHRNDVYVRRPIIVSPTFVSPHSTSTMGTAWNDDIFLWHRIPNSVPKIDDW